MVTHNSMEPRKLCSQEGIRHFHRVVQTNTTRKDTQIRANDHTNNSHRKKTWEIWTAQEQVEEEEVLRIHILTRDDNLLDRADLTDVCDEHAE